MLRGEVVLITAHDGEVGLRLGIGEREGIFPQERAVRGKIFLQQPKQAAGDGGMQGGLGHFLDEDAADEFGTPTVLIELGELPVLRDGERRNPGADFGQIEDRRCGRHAGEIARCGRGVQWDVMAPGGREGPS